MWDEGTYLFPQIFWAVYMHIVLMCVVLLWLYYKSWWRHQMETFSALPCSSWMHVPHIPIFFKVASVALGQSYIWSMCQCNNPQINGLNWPLPKQSKVQTMCIILGMHCIICYAYCNVRKPWWRHQMETFSALLALCAGNSPVTGEFPTWRPVTQSFDVSFDLRLNKRLSKQS